MDGLSSPAGQFSPEGYIGYSSRLKADPYDMALAKKLITEAGYGDGFKLTLHGPAGRYSNDTRILEAIAQMLSSVGIETSVETNVENHVETNARDLTRPGQRPGELLLRATVGEPGWVVKGVLVESVFRMYLTC